METEMTADEVAEHMRVKPIAVTSWRAEGLPVLSNGKYDLFVTMCWVVGNRWSKRPDISKLTCPTDAEKIAIGWLAAPTAEGPRRDDFFSFVDRCRGCGIEKEEVLVALHAAMSASLSLRS